MSKINTYLVAIFSVLAMNLYSQKNIIVYGKVTDKATHKPIDNVGITVANSTYGTSTNDKGFFSVAVPQKKHLSILFRLLGYEMRLKEFDLAEGQDSIFISLELTAKSRDMDTISISGSNKPDTLVGSPKYSIYDFDFYENNFILLTAIKSLENAELKYADASGKIISTYAVPKEGGEAKEFFHDYMGFTNLICKNIIYRINIYHDRFILIPLSIEDMNGFIKPIIDTVNNKLIFSDYWKDYPLFNYYSFNNSDSVQKTLHTIEDKELMHAYNFEYYSLKPREKLEARRMADDLKIDKRIVASLMSGFTQSMFYEPLFAPLYIVSDTMCVFDHYKNLLFHYNNKGLIIDSISISYNHPKNWKEWKNVMLKDEIEKTIFAVYEKNGHKYIKQINSKNGKEIGKYVLQFHSATKLKIHNGYAYYIYRPFESTQQKFFYRELIRLTP